MGITQQPDELPAKPDSRFNGLVTLGNRQVLLRTADERLVGKMRQDLGLEDELARMLARRGYNAESSHAYLNPSLRLHLPDPLHFVDMDKAVERSLRAIKTGEMISVFTDYDADGATSGSIAINFLRWIGVPATKYVPDRSKEGYGPNANAMQQLRSEGSSLCLMFDCGTAAIDRLKNGILEPGPLTVAKQIGLDVCVFDHHTPEAALPQAYSIVNPKRLDETTPHRNLAACGMSLMFVIALNRALREQGFYRQPGETGSNKPREPYVKRLFELAAIGTMQDMVELTGVNRLIVHTGLALMNEPEHTDEQLARMGYTREEFGRYRLPGVEALRAACRRSRDDMMREGRFLDEQDLSFQIGPRLNAPGRIARARTSLDLLTMENGLEALEFASQASDDNSNRKEIEALIVSQAMPQADDQAARGDPVIIAAGEGWDPGVIGVAASRIKEKHDRPVIVIGSLDNKWKGSGRSVKSWDGSFKVDLGGAITAALHQGLLLAGGGHPMACGLSIEPDKIEEFRAFLHKRLGPQMAKLPKVPILPVDAVISADSINDELIAMQKRMAPFGEGNQKPLYLIPNARVAFSNITSDGKSVSCSFHRMNNGLLRGIAFKAADQAHGQALIDTRGGLLHLLGHVDEHFYNGKRTLQVRILDALRP